MITIIFNTTEKKEFDKRDYELGTSRYGTYFYVRDKLRNHIKMYIPITSVKYISFD